LSAATAASAAVPFNAGAAMPKPYSFDAIPPMNDAASFVRWMQENRGEDARYLRTRFRSRSSAPISTTADWCRSCRSTSWTATWSKARTCSV